MSRSVKLVLAMSEDINDNAFFFGCHEGITQEQREAIVGYFHEFFQSI